MPPIMYLSYFEADYVAPAIVISTDVNIGCLIPIAERSDDNVQASFYGRISVAGARR